MGVPKRISSKSRKRSRKSANRWVPPALVKNKKTANWIMSHRVDPTTGMYKDRQVITLKSAEKP
ncbi:50S ribosomal protein L32 [Methylacidiphilum caldifontis]|uniref:50S ribosomal protein L32 n=1 Tax=Methylacidiphilum caldifontis TaxID=2795386 RepID=UPI00106D8683|nr:50S ribosomal protein L32 [Methylacidiphilum caldifontis]QSR88876.1 50S ribosomal protein L32 [Methylacidiphilum caldifontis]